MVIEEIKEKNIVCCIGVFDIFIFMICRLMMFGDIWNKILIEYVILLINLFLLIVKF